VTLTLLVAGGHPEGRGVKGIPVEAVDVTDRASGKLVGDLPCRNGGKPPDSDASSRVMKYCPDSSSPRGLRKYSRAGAVAVDAEDGARPFWPGRRWCRRTAPRRPEELISEDLSLGLSARARNSQIAKHERSGRLLEAGLPGCGWRAGIAQTVRPDVVNDRHLGHRSRSRMPRRYPPTRCR
jgi:hypothetical protein